MKYESFRRMTGPVLLVLTVLFNGCIQDQNGDDTHEFTVTAALDEEFSLEVDQTAYIRSEGIVVTFVNVTEDSRCPSDLVCVWGGWVTVAVHISIIGQDMGTYDVTLSSGQEELAVEVFDDYAIRLIEVDPYPETSNQTPLADYTATFSVFERSELHSTSAALDEQFLLRINQTAYIMNESIVVTFRDVTQDSRCPSDVVCIWQGSVTVVVNITEGGLDIGDFHITLIAGSEGEAFANCGDYRIWLIRVDPYPITTVETTLSDYVATFHVTENA
jgi:hypothetical protein